MLTEQLQIYRDTFVLGKTLLMYNDKISKQVRYGIYAECISMICEALDKIYVANTDIDKRCEVLNDVICLFGGVRSRIRMLAESKYLTVKQQNYIMLQIEKVKKQATGWNKHAKSQSHEFE